MWLEPTSAPVAVRGATEYGVRQPCCRLGKRKQETSQDRQGHGLPCFVTLQDREDNLMRMKRIVQVAV